MLTAMITCSVWGHVLNELSYRVEIFVITWCRWSAFRNRFVWDVVEPIKAWLWDHGYITEKPLSVLAREIRAIREEEERTGKVTWRL